MFKQYKEGKISSKEYRDWWAQSKGYKNITDYESQKNHKTKLHTPITDNKNTSLYLGVVVSERVLSKIFEKVKRMPMHNKGFDFICKHGYKIDVKSACLFKDGVWKFKILKNKNTDYFLFLGFDNREELNPKRIWLIKGTEIITTKYKTCQLNEKTGLTIRNTKEGRKLFRKYSQTNKLEKVIACCNVIKH